jgi:hypothetical protein
VIRAARFAAVYATLMAAHDVADHVLQSEHQATVKAKGGPVGWRALAGHIASYHATQVAALAVADRTLGLGLRPGRVAAAVALSAATHALLDRRWPVDRVLSWTGHPDAAPGKWRSGRQTVPLAPLVEALTALVRLVKDDPTVQLPRLPDDLADWPVPLHGPYLADQALHHACLWAAALIATGGTK